MVVCVAVYVWQHLLISREAAVQFLYAFALVPAVLTGSEFLPAAVEVVPPFLTVLTSMFLHGGFWHLAGNMLYLWIFGNNVEEAMGRARFLVFYLICGAGAVFAQLVANPGSVVPMVGASGA